MNIDEKKIPESTLPEHSELPSQEQITDEELEQVAGGSRMVLFWDCPKCGASLNKGVCPKCPYIAE